jgi:hypothetical protein
MEEEVAANREAADAILEALGALDVDAEDEEQVERVDESVIRQITEVVFEQPTAPLQPLQPAVECVEQEELCLPELWPVTAEHVVEETNFGLDAGFCHWIDEYIRIGNDDDQYTDEYTDDDDDDDNDDDDESVDE